ncbi:MAG: glycosyltransferase family 4 protein [Clostridium sp.]|nr:glycosyltransferase family 4 protein [Clostridium sp.]
MNILIIHNKYRFAGGEDTVVENEVQLLRSHGHHVVTYLVSNEQIGRTGIAGKLFLPFRTLYSVRSRRETEKLIREHRIEVVHVHNTLPLVSFSVYRAAKKNGCRLVQTIHNMRFVCANGLLYREGHACEECLQKGMMHSVKYGCYRHSKAQTFLVDLMFWVHRRLGTFRKPDCYLVLTKFCMEKLRQAIPQEKMILKANFVAERKEITEKESFFVCVGRTERMKGTFEAVEAFEKLPEERLVLIGEGEDEAQLRALIHDRKIANVEMKGKLSHEESLSYIARAKGLLFTSHLYEGMPMTILEAYAAGCPVIAADTPNVRTIVRDGETGFLYHVCDSADLREKIKKVSAMPQEGYEALCRGAFAEYERSYSAETIYQELIEAYQG